MNYFGINLTGKKVVYKAKQFYKKDASVKERTFLCESGPGCLATKEESIGQYMKPYGYATITAQNLDDGSQEKIDSYALEAYFNRAGNLIPREDDFTEQPMVEVQPTLLTPASTTNESHPRGRTAWKPAPAETTTAVVTNVVEGVALSHRHPAPAQPAPVNGTLVTVAEGGLDLAEKVDTTGAAVRAAATGLLEWDAAAAVALYVGGMKVADIAEHFGNRERQNRVRKACREAGVYKENGR